MRPPPAPSGKEGNDDVRLVPKHTAKSTTGGLPGFSAQGPSGAHIAAVSGAQGASRAAPTSLRGSDDSDGNDDDDWHSAPPSSRRAASPANEFPLHNSCQALDAAICLDGSDVDMDSNVRGSKRPAPSSSSSDFDGRDRPLSIYDRHRRRPHDGRPERPDGRESLVDLFRGLTTAGSHADMIANLRN